MKKYNPSEIERKWQERWEKARAFRAWDFREKKFYQLEMFPYPSGKIHMGHVRNYTIGDVVARYKRMRGYNVLHPIGFDAFGLPAENAAIEHGVHPAKWTYSNIEYMTKQLKKMGFSYDWDRLVITCDPDYYRWEQKVFVEMFERGMVYRKKTVVNFCPTCNTVLANEQVVEDGKCWRCGDSVEEREFYSWFFRITDYADELLNDIEKLRGMWPDRVLVQQINWIGRSEGAFIKFGVDGSDRVLEVFTTRPDTLFGVTFVSIALDHPLIDEIVKNTDVKAKIEALRDSERRAVRGFGGEREKKGIFTGVYAVNPANGEKVPLYAANFVLMEYGTGVVMGVPAHDQRDFEFAKEYGLPLRLVIYREGESEDAGSLNAAYEGRGILINSGEFNGMDSEEAKWAIVKTLEGKGLARRGFQYKLRDWNVSRQRYWGCPIPIIYCPKCGTVAESLDNLPVKLPEDVEITGKGGSPLSQVDSFVRTKCPLCGGDAARETDTFDTFVESSWYYMRYASPEHNQDMFDGERVSYWMPVDQYIGGIEHAVLHLLYSRYYTKVLRDLGYVNFDEPFTRLLTQGMVIKDGAKMSKSKGNVVDPDDIINEYGADSARLFILFAAPPEKDLEWSDEGIEGSFRFISRMFRLVSSFQDISRGEYSIDSDRMKELSFMMHNTVKRVTESIDRFHFNTGIAALMEFVNFLQAFSPNTEGEKHLFAVALERLVVLSSVFIPHVAEEMWEMLGKDGFVSLTVWPDYDSSAVVRDEVTFALMVNGKLRDTVTAPVGSSEDEILRLAMGSQRVRRHVKGKEIIKKIFVKNKLLNLVVR